MRFDPLVILDFVCSFLRCILGCVWLDVKYFSARKIFSSVWLHSKKYFGKYFLVFGCILENALENPFLSCSRRMVVNGFDDFWVRDDLWWMSLTISGFAIWGMGSTARSLCLSLSLCLRVWVLPSLALSLSLFGHCLTNELSLGFFGFVRALRCGSILPSPVLRCWCDLSSIFLGRKWFEVKMRTKIIFRPLSLILRLNRKHF